jgi:hypothetical protein
MTKQQYTSLVAQVARTMIVTGNRPTVQAVARWSEGRSGSREVQQFSDTRFSRFVADVSREVAAQLQEADDLAAALGR